MKHFLKKLIVAMLNKLIYKEYNLLIKMLDNLQ